MALYDCFMYFDEDMLLDIRLNTLNNIVDKFIIAEGTRTHSGEEKKLNFDIKKFSKFKDKIEYLIIDDIPLNVSKYKKDWSASHIRDQYQRNSIERGYKECSENDIIIPLNSKEMQLAMDSSEYINESWALMCDSVYQRLGIEIIGKLNINYIVVNGLAKDFH